MKNRMQSMWNARKEIVLAIKEYLKLTCFKKEWRSLNPHNGTTAVNLFPIEKVHVGDCSYGPLKVYSYDNPQEQLQIGSFCSIAPDVSFFLGGEHRTDTVSSFPIWTHYLGHEKAGVTLSKGPIVVQDDVWIGAGSMILSGVTLGKGCVIGAGSVVFRDVPPYAVYAGNRVVKYRLDREAIDELVSFDLHDLRNLPFEQQEEAMASTADPALVRRILQEISTSK